MKQLDIHHVKSVIGSCYSILAFGALCAAAIDSSQPKNIIIGIDLGTTYSAVGVYQNGKVEIIPNEQGSRITPSWVAFTDDGERLVGDAAKNQFSHNPKNTIFDVKRLIGRSASDPDVLKEQQNLPFTIQNNNNKPSIVIEDARGQSQRFCPEEISAWVLQNMKETAEKYLGQEVNKAVVTVPAYFNDEQRQATKDAGKIAGLEIVRILNEPTAAALAYGLDKNTEKEKNVIVFDLGGGTFDVSLLTIDQGVFEVLATNGDTHLGGEDFDQRVIDYMIKLYKKKTGKDVRGDKRAMAKLRRECEKAKRALSSLHAAKVEIDAFFEGDDFSAELTRAKFEELNLDLFKETMIPVRNVLKDAGMTKDDIDQIVLVGGSTRIPRIQQMVKDFFGKEAAKGINPDESVAYGAAVQAAVLGGFDVGDDGVVIIDTAPLTLAIETVGGVMAPIVERNSAIPTKRSKIFSTAADNQEAVSIRVFEGERPMTKDNNLLGQFDLSGIPAARRGEPQIEVTFQIDSDGILRVSAEEKATGRKNQIQIENDSGRLSATEIEEMIKLANEMADHDARDKQRIESRNAFESSVYNTQNEVTTNEKLSPVDQEALNTAIDEALKWLEANEAASTEEFKEAKSDFENVTGSILNSFSDDKL